MASSLRLILSLILFLSLIKSGHAKTSTENLIINKSDILEVEKSTKIEEGDFFEDVQINLDGFVWIVNLKNGPFSTEEKANQAALELKKILGSTLPKFPKEISILHKSKSPNKKNFNKAKFSWMINLRLGVYDSKDKALQIAQELKAIQKVPENVFLTRETKNIKTSKFAENNIPEVSGQIFLSREATQIKDKAKHFILVATKSNSLNVRKNPSSSSPVIARLLKGSKVPHIKNNTPKNRNDSWFYIEYSKGKFGWVSSSYTKKITDSGSRISQQAKLKTVKPKKVHTGEAPRTSEFRELKSLVALLQTELDKIKTDKAKKIEATNQANTKAKEERLASIKEFKTLKDKSSAEINDLHTITMYLRSELNKIKSDKTNAIEARNRSRAKLEISVTESNKKIKDLETTTVSLRSELDKIKSDKTRAVEATNQANTKAKEERLASSKEFQSLKEKSSKQIKDLETTTASLRSELDKIKSDKTRAIETSDRASTRLQAEKLANAKLVASLKVDNKKEISNLREKNINKINKLKEKNRKEIVKLKFSTASLQKELEQIKGDKEDAINAIDQTNAKLKAEKIANAKLVASLNADSKNRVDELKFSTASLQKELEQIKGDKEDAINAIDQTNAKLKAEKIANAKLVASLNADNKKRVDELKFSTASLQKELEQIKGDKEDAVNSIAQTKANLQTTKLNNIEFTNQLKDTVIFLRKELDKIKDEKTEPIRTVNQTNDKLKAGKLANFAEINRVKETSHEKILDLESTVASLRSELNKTKDVRTNKLTAIKQANIKSNKMFKASTSDIKTLNSTIKNLRTVLETFKLEKLKAAEARKSRDTKIATEQTIREKEINVLKKESIALKLQLDKANLDRVKAIEGVNFNNIETQANQLAQGNEFNIFKQESEIEIANLKGVNESLRNQLAHLMSGRTRSIQPKTLLSSAEKLRGLTSPASTKQKNKTTGILDKPAKKKIISKKKLLPSSTDINPESIIHVKLLHWVKAWESRNAPLYLSFYSKSFWHPKKSRSLWESHRRKSLEKTLINYIQISNIKKYILNENLIRVTFIQRFKSNKFSDIGLKELVWKKDPDGWKILKETWKPR